MQPWYFYRMKQMDKEAHKADALKNKVSEFDQAMDVQGACPDLRREWIPRAELMKYFGYGDTQMCAITKKYGLVTSQIGKRIFFSKTCLLQVLAENAK